VVWPRVRYNSSVEHEMIYMDNAATSWPKPEEVYRAMDSFMRANGANPGRSGHRPSIEAGRVIFETREALAALFGVGDPKRIVFTLNATEALNVVIRGMLRPGDHVITSSVEHNSVMRPLRATESSGVQITVVGCSKEGTLDPRELEKAIRSNTRLIILNHASNVVGTVLPIGEVGRIARNRGIPLLVDAAQTAGCQPINVEELNIDLLAFSGHKGLFGPQGTGGLYIRKGLEADIPPLKRGGTGSRSEHEYQPDFLPDKYESGTPNTVGLAGLRAGLRFIQEVGLDTIRMREASLTSGLIEGLENVPEVIIYGTGHPEKQVAIVSFNVSGMTPSEVATQLEEDNVLCRPGLHCAPMTHRMLGTFPQGTVRLSPGYFTPDGDVEKTLKAVRRISDERKRRGKTGNR
jgi:cysteine desulfurase family protein